MSRRTEVICDYCDIYKDKISGANRGKTIYASAGRFTDAAESADDINVEVDICDSCAFELLRELIKNKDKVLSEKTHNDILDFINK